MEFVKKNICIIVSSVSIINEFLVKHIEALSIHFNVHLVVNLQPSTIIETDKLIEIYNIPIKRKPHIFSDILSFFKLFFYIRRKKFHAVHTITPKGGGLGMLASFINRVPIRIHIFTGQVWYTKTGFRKLLLRYFDRLIAYMTTHNLVDGHSQRNFLLEQKVLRKEKSFVLGPGSISGVNIDLFQFNHSIREKLRSLYSVDHDATVFAFLGRINKDKGVNDLAEAFKMLYRTNNKCFLVFIGLDEEELKPTIIGNFKEEGIENLLFLDYTRKPYELLQMADVFCLPSYREGFGTSVIEASALGLPVICSDTYGLNETLIANKTGLRHKIGDIQDLKRQMEFLMNNKQLIREFGIAGHEYVKQTFDAKEITSLWIDFYIQTLKV